MTLRSLRIYFLLDSTNIPLLRRWDNEGKNTEFTRAGSGLQTGKVRADSRPLLQFFFKRVSVQGFFQGGLPFERRRM